MAPFRWTCITTAALLGSLALGVVGCGGSPDPEKRLRAHASEWLGTPFADGGQSRDGVDCSGYVQLICQDALGLELPRTAKEQERLGEKIAADSLSAGDLVFFRTKGLGPFFKKRHVGVYLEGGEFVHVSSKKGVSIDRLDDHYWKRAFKQARRVPRPG